MTFGLTPQGFNAKRLADIKVSLEDGYVAQFGDINLDPQSVFGQLVGVDAKPLADLWENLEDVYLSQYPNSASGVALDNVVQFNGISRKPATQTSVVATCGGLEGTYIPQNSLATIPLSGAVFYADQGGSITANNADFVKVQVGTVTTQPYTIVLNNVSFVYSIPIITFSNSGAIFVTGNSIVVTINGVALPAVSYASSSNATLAAIATAISNFGTGSELVATPTNPATITIVPNSGFSAATIQITITGGASQAGSAITYQAPANANAITSRLTALLNVGTPTWLATDNIDGTLSINTLLPNNPFIAQVGLNLTIALLSSPISFLCENYGPISCPENALNTILTPIAGWNSVTNWIAGVTGTLTENDAELRIRRANSIKLLGNCTVEAIEAQLEQKVPGVTSATVFENRTLRQQSYVIVFGSAFASSDVVTVSYDNNNYNFTVTCPSSPNQATSMGLLVAAFESLPEVSSASYGGAGNQTLTVNMNISQVIFLDSVTTSVSAQTATITGGRPPKSFEAVVQGGTDDAVANQIWLSKPAGIETYGNTQVAITDSQGNTQTIFFSRPTNVYIFVQVALTLYTEETFPVNGLQQVQEAIYNYGISLGVGIDVLFQRVLAQIFRVPGIASGDMQIAATTSPTQNPSYGTSDITISDTQISVFNLDVIFVSIA